MLFFIFKVVTAHSKNFKTDDKYTRLAFALLFLSLISSFNPLWIAFCISELALLLLYRSRSMKGQVAFTAYINLVFSLLYFPHTRYIFSVISLMEVMYFREHFLIALVCLFPFIYIAQVICLPLSCILLAFDKRSLTNMCLVIYRFAFVSFIVYKYVVGYSRVWDW